MTGTFHVGGCAGVGLIDATDRYSYFVSAAECQHGVLPQDGALVNFLPFPAQELYLRQRALAVRVIRAPRTRPEAL